MEDKTMIDVLSSDVALLERWVPQLEKDGARSVGRQVRTGCGQVASEEWFSTVAEYLVDVCKFRVAVLTMPDALAAWESDQVQAFEDEVRTAWRDVRCGMKFVHGDYVGLRQFIVRGLEQTEVVIAREMIGRGGLNDV